MSKNPTAPPPDPLARSLDCMNAALYDDKGTLVAAVFPPHEQDTARRLGACFNAFRGFSTEDIERGCVEVKRVTNRATDNASIKLGPN